MRKMEQFQLDLLEKLQRGGLGGAGMAAAVANASAAVNSAGPTAGRPEDASGPAFVGDDATQLTLLKQENDHLRRQLKLARGGVADQMAGQGASRLPCGGKRCPCAPNRCQCAGKVARGGSVQGLPGGSAAAASMMAQLHEAEKRYASLMSKCAMLEEEGGNYKKHMQVRTTIGLVLTGLADQGTIRFLGPRVDRASHPRARVTSARSLLTWSHSACDRCDGPRGSWGGTRWSCDGTGSWSRGASWEGPAGG